MQGCIDALKTNIGAFVKRISSADANNESPVKDWRIRVCGYRDHEKDGEANWFIWNPFVKDVTAVEGQLVGLVAKGGGDEPESLLDALYSVTMVGQSEVQDDPVPDKWRHRDQAVRVVVVFTDATYKEKMSIPEAKGGGLDDIADILMLNKIVMNVICPEDDCYRKFGELGGSAFISLGAAPGKDAVEAMKTFTSKAENFKNIMDDLGKSVIQSARSKICK
jgi:hypothetical protein